MVGVVGWRVGVPGAVIVLSVNVSAELDAVIGCCGTERKWPSCKKNIVLVLIVVLFELAAQEAIMRMMVIENLARVDRGGEAR